MNIRPIDPSDGAKYRSILERTSSEDRYCRFFHHVDHFSEEFVDRYVTAQPDVLGFIALDDDGTPLGAAHAIRLENEPRKAELAIVVAQDARRRGVARALLNRLIDALGEWDCDSLIAYALRENRVFTRLARSAGMRADPIGDGATAVWRLAPPPRRERLWQAARFPARG